MIDEGIFGDQITRYGQPFLSIWLRGPSSWSGGCCGTFSRPSAISRHSFWCLPQLSAGFPSNTRRISPSSIGPGLTGSNVRLKDGRFCPPPLVSLLVLSSGQSSGAH